jgi:hypothetical protein
MKFQTMKYNDQQNKENIYMHLNEFKQVAKKFMYLKRIQIKSWGK